jgi:hypothetical protein
MPSKVNIPTVETSIPTATSTTVLINWSAPIAHSSTIIEYDVRFLTSTGLYVTSTSCPSTDVNLIANTECTVEMSAIILLTGLSRDSKIRVKVRARNGINWGEYSELNTEGATIETVPLGASSVSFDLDRTLND